MWVFVIYSFLGWIVEVIYTKFEYNKWVNRGFLNGPYCPIYGFGVLIILSLLSHFSDNIIALFIGSVLLTTALEFITGYVLEKIFHQKWWDYSVDAFNFKGYICLWVSITWGIACVIVIYFIQPVVENFILTFPREIGNILLSITVTLITVDLGMTIFSLAKLKQRVIHLDQLLAKIGAISDSVNKNIANGTSVAKQNTEKLDQLIKKYQEAVNEKIFGYKRITKAFPKFRPIKHKKPNGK